MSAPLTMYLPASYVLPENVAFFVNVIYTVLERQTNERYKRYDRTNSNNVNYINNINYE